MKITEKQFKSIEKNINNGFYQVEECNATIYKKLKESYRLINPISFYASSFKITKSVKLFFIYVHTIENKVLIYVCNNIYSVGELLEVDINLYETLLSKSTFKKNKTNRQNQFTYHLWRDLCNIEEYLINYKTNAERLQEIREEIKLSETILFDVNLKLNNLRKQEKKLKEVK